MDKARFIVAHCIIVTSFLMKLFRIVFSIYGFLVFVILMLLLFPLIFIASFFGAVTGGNIIYYICRFWANACFFLWESGIKIFLKDQKVNVTLLYSSLIICLISTFR